MILVVNANTNDCRIYHYDMHPTQLILVKEINHPESKLKNGDLISDKEGHYKVGQSSRGAYSPHTEAKEVEVINFSRKIALELNQRRNANEYEKLILITPPHMYGLLSQHLNKHVASLMTNHIQKDLIYMKDHELLSYLQENAKYPN